MSEQSADPSGNEMADDILQQAIASIEGETVPPGPSPEQIDATLHALRYPFRSREVRDICKHMTPDESRRLIAYTRKFGFVGGILISVLMYSLMFPLMWMCTPFYPPYPLFLTPFLIAIPLGLFVGWIGFAGFRKKQRLMLYETDYAKQMGFTPDTLPLYSFTKNKTDFLFPFIVAAALLGVLFLLPYGLTRPNYGDPAAGKIIDRMARVYANCNSYRDSGVVTTLYLTDTGNRTTAKPFTTAFVRSDRFRFECKQDLGGKTPYRSIIWSNWKDIKPWWNFWSNRFEIQTWQDVKPGIEKPTSLDSALVLAGHSAENIPKQLLHGEVWFPRLTQITETKLAEDDKLGKVECFLIEGMWADRPITLWIDKKSYLVRRTDERYEVKEANGKAFRVEMTTTYDPIIDEKIADKLLEFDPPAPK
jgi:hypothetical protein